MKIEDVLENLRDSLANTANETLPQIVIALFIVTIGVIVAAVLRKVARSVLGTFVHSKPDSVIFSGTTPELLASLVFWFVLLMFISSASSSVGFDPGTQVINSILAYVPSIVIAAIIMIVGSLIGRILKQHISAWVKESGLVYGDMVGSYASMLVLLVSAIIAIQQLGIDVSIIVANLSIIVGAIAVAFALAFGLGTRDIVGNRVAAYYVLQNYKIGQHISVDGVEGTIEKAVGPAIHIKTDSGVVSIPAKQVLESKVYLS